jgi:hypothetical protein
LQIRKRVTNGISTKQKHQIKEAIKKVKKVKTIPVTGSGGP